MYYGVFVASQRYHGKESLTYASETSLSEGQLVAVLLQSKAVVGIVEKEVEKPAFNTKPVINSWPIFLPIESLALLKWLSEYYPSPLGMITELFTPPTMTKKIPVLEKSGETKLSEVLLPTLTDEQQTAFSVIDSANNKPILLHGDTGTGKTRVYIEMAQQVLAKNKSVIILTPEIGLTQPLLDSLSHSFKNRVVVTHSDMTTSERRNIWLRANYSEKGLVVVGPRSALFMPLKNIGLIVMDEAHDTAYKQEQAPYYQTSRVAGKLASLHGAQLILGSATPAISDYFTFEHKKLHIVRMTQPAIKHNQETSLEIVDLRDKNQFTKSMWLSDILLSAIDLALKNNEQSLLFLNRRGSARLVLCNSCGWQAMCPHCDVALTYHSDLHAMRCHSCEFNDSVPTSCPKCTAGELIFRSIGTKALEAEIKRLFPQAKVSRFDRDTIKSHSLSQQHEQLHSGQIDVLIGTQTIAKGFDLPKLGVVGIISADSGLQIPDYTASERTFQLISQVSGRIGRGHRAGKLIVQTFEPDSKLISMALNKNYKEFYALELKQRQLYSFPPYSFLLKITCSRANSKSAKTACQKIASDLLHNFKGVAIEGPSPRFIEKIAGRYAWHLVLKSKNRDTLLQIIDKLPSNCTYDLDPSDLL